MPPTNQRTILASILTRSAAKAAELKAGDRMDWRRGQEMSVLQRYGIRYDPGEWLGRQLTLSESASFSRTLRQLMGQNLVTGNNRRGYSDRVTHVKLTPAGEIRAKEMLEAAHV